jgi:hypothetical protein
LESRTTGPKMNKLLFPFILVSFFINSAFSSDGTVESSPVQDAVLRIHESMPEDSKNKRLADLLCDDGDWSVLVEQVTKKDTLGFKSQIHDLKKLLCVEEAGIADSKCMVKLTKPAEKYQNVGIYINENLLNFFAAQDVLWDEVKIKRYNAPKDLGSDDLKVLVWGISSLLERYLMLMKDVEMKGENLMPIKDLVKALSQTFKHYNKDNWENKYAHERLMNAIKEEEKEKEEEEDGDKNKDKDGNRKDNSNKNQSPDAQPRSLGMNILLYVVLPLLGIAIILGVIIYFVKQRK